MIEFFAVVTAVSLCVALGALYLLGRFSIAQGRFDTDALNRASQLQRHIDVQVERRVAYGRVAVRSAPELTGSAVDPNVRSAGRIDDVHEAEREEARLRGESDEPAARDTFADQPIDRIEP